MKLLLKITTALLLLCSLGACAQANATNKIPGSRQLSKLAGEIVIGRISDIQKDQHGKTTAVIQVEKGFKGQAKSGDLLIFEDQPLAKNDNFSSTLAEDQRYLFLLKESEGKTYYQLVNPFLGKIALKQKDLAIGPETPSNFEQVRGELLTTYF